MQPRFLVLFGPFAYVVVWLFVLPVVADLSTRVAIMSLTLLTSLYCFGMARTKKRGSLLWSTIGALAGFIELGLLPVLIISALSSGSGVGPDAHPNQAT